MIRNKQGQLGKLITSFPIMLLIFVIMVVFVIISAALSATRIHEGRTSEFLSFGSDGDLMLKEISVNIGGQMQEMRTIDAFALYLTGEADKGSFVNSLKNLLDSDNNCIIFSAIGAPGSIIGVSGNVILIVNFKKCRMASWKKEFSALRITRIMEPRGVSA